MAEGAAVPRLYLNHDVHKVAASALRREGYDVIAAVEVGMETATDEEQVAYAARERRALISFNVRDYPGVHTDWVLGGQEHWGIVLSPQLPLRRTLDKLRALLKDICSEDLRNQLRWL